MSTVSPLMVLLFGSMAAILGIQWLAAALIRRRVVPLRSALRFLLGITIITTGLWFLASYAFGWWAALCCFPGENTPERDMMRDMIDRTILLPLNFCYYFPAVQGWLGGIFCSALFYFMLIPGTLFALGLLVFPVVRPHGMKGQ